MTSVRGPGADVDRRQVRVHTVHHVGALATAPQIVLVHGIGTSHRYFRRLQRELARHGTVHAVDLPGFGGLPRPRTPLSVAELAGALGARLDALGLGPVVLVGHSMGTQVVLELAVQRPELVSGLVLIGPVTDEARATAGAQALDLLRSALGEPWTGNAMVVADYLRCGPRWFLAELPPMLDYPTAQAAGRVACPVLVIRGERDRVARRDWSAELARTAADGHLVEIRRARHLVHHRAPEQTAAAIVALVGDPAASSGGRRRGVTDRG